MIARKRIVIDIENGAVYWPNGKPVHTRENFWGYSRFQVRVRRRDGKRVTNWFFVHKAVVIARGVRFRKEWEINHKDHNRANNRSENLEYIHRRLNMQLKAPLTYEPEPAF